MLYKEDIFVYSIKLELKMSEQTKTNTVFIIQMAAIVILVAFLMYGLGKSSTTSNVITGDVTSSEIIPTGIPNVYGEELAISYDGVSASNPQLADQTISILSGIDRSVTLSGADLERYIRVTSEISCEYCCGAKSIIRSDGSSACGCAHSYAMRGLSKYLITQHGDEFSDDEILSELGKWKVLFFPGIHEQKAAVLQSQGIELNYVNLASNKYRGIEDGQSSGGGMVGGC